MINLKFWDKKNDSETLVSEDEDLSKLYDRIEELEHDIQVEIETSDGKREAWDSKQAMNGRKTFIDKKDGSKYFLKGVK